MKIKKWLKAQQLKWDSKYLQRVAKRSPELLTEFVMQKANQISMRTVMMVLDREGLAHCVYCPTRFNLRKHNHQWICQPHYNAVMTANKKEEQSAAPKKKELSASAV